MPLRRTWDSRRCLGLRQASPAPYQSAKCAESQSRSRVLWHWRSVARRLLWQLHCMGQAYSLPWAPRLKSSHHSPGPVVQTSACALLGTPLMTTSSLGLRASESNKGGYREDELRQESGSDLPSRFHGRGCRRHAGSLFVEGPPEQRMNPGLPKVGRAGRVARGRRQGTA